MLAEGIPNLGTSAEFDACSAKFDPDLAKLGDFSTALGKKSLHSEKLRGLFPKRELSNIAQEDWAGEGRGWGGDEGKELGGRRRGGEWRGSEVGGRKEGHGRSEPYPSEVRQSKGTIKLAVG